MLKRLKFGCPEQWRRWWQLHIMPALGGYHGDAASARLEQELLELGVAMGRLHRSTTRRRAGQHGGSGRLTVSTAGATKEDPFWCGRYITWSVCTHGSKSRRQAPAGPEVQELHYIASQNPKKARSHTS